MGDSVQFIKLDEKSSSFWKKTRMIYCIASLKQTMIWSKCLGGWVRPHRRPRGQASCFLACGHNIWHNMRCLKYQRQNTKSYFLSDRLSISLKDIAYFLTTLLSLFEASWAVRNWGNLTIGLKIQYICRSFKDGNDWNIMQVFMCVYLVWY